MILAHLNNSSIRNKMHEVREILSSKCVDGFGLSETKIDESFPTAQFNVPDFKLYPEDRDVHGGGVARYVRSTLTHRQRSDIAVNEYPEYYSRSNSEKGEMVLCYHAQTSNCQRC